MLITGSTYRSIASQNILSYSINGNIDSTTGISSFGLSGDNGSLNLFTFRTGKIYDVNNRHVWSYNPSESFAISGNINTGDHHYYINDNLICLSTPKPDHYYKYFYANSQNSVMDLDINIIGNNNPNYSISFPFTYTIGDNITGYISNNSDNSNFSFQFFTGQTVGQPYYSIFNFNNNFISGTQSGELILNYTSILDPTSPNSGAGDLEPLLGNLSFSTNFGNVVYNLNIPINKRPYYFADFIEIFTGIIQQDSFFNYNYVYELRTKSPNDQDVFISLSNKAGHLKELYSGAFSATGTISNTLSGFIYGDDYITGILTGNVVSNFPDYYGNLITGFGTGFESIQQYATGEINYYYRVPVPGGSALGTAPPGTIIEATGYISGATGISFIYGSRTVASSIITTGRLSGYFGPHLQTGTGFIVLTGESLNYFTGVSNIDNIHFNWDSIPYIGFDIENYNSNYNYKIYGITGSGNYTFRSSDSGVLTTGITTQQNTGELINYLFRLNSYDISDISGDIFGSENTYDLRYVFGENSDFQWGTGPNISTGFLGFEFKNFSPDDSGIISNYELNLDRNFYNYKFVPSVFKLQGSNNNISWNDMDTRSGINFYRSQTNIFPVTGTGLYNYVRLLITSGQLLQHVNQNDLDETSFGLSVNKIYFYEKTVSGNVTGLYKNFIDNDVTGNYFYSSFNTGVEPDYFFSNDEDVDLFFVSKLDKQSYPYVQITGGFIGYKTAYVYTGTRITGFYINFQPGYSPERLIIDASTGINYTKFYDKTLTSNIESGIFQTGILISGLTGYNHFRFNFTGSAGIPIVRVKKLNLYDSRQKDFFDLNPITITGFGNVNILSSGFGTGFLANPTGEIYYPAVSYETGLLTGLITDGGSYTWNDIFISSTGRPNNVFVDRVTGFRNATGIIRFKMDLIRNFDYITINDITFNYNNEVSDSNYNFHDLWKLINVLNFGATGALNDFTLSDVVGVTGGLNIESFKTGLLTGGIGVLSSQYIKSVDINNDNIIVVGEPNFGINGSVNIYSKNSDNDWILYQNISGNRADGSYGESVSINKDGTKIVMGGPRFNNNLGAFDIYVGDKTNGWSLQQSIGGYYNNIGGYAAWGATNSIAINSGDRILVGGYASHNLTGRITLYTGVNNFSLAPSINIGPPASIISVSSLQPRFGRSVAMNNIGNLFVIGAPHMVGGYGNVCIYDASSLGSVINLQNLSSPGGDRDKSITSSFGTSVAVNDDGRVIVVGTPFFSTGSSILVGGYQVGLVSIYTSLPSNPPMSPPWILKQEITGVLNQNFLGTDVDINSNGSIIGIGGYNNSLTYYTGNYINGWSVSNIFTGSSKIDSIAVNDSIVIGGYGLLNLACVSEIDGASMRLFSHNPSGENGNNTKLTRYASDLNAIQIPNRYLLGGQTFRPLSNTWEGNFEETFNFTVENSGIYTVQSEENIFIDISGVAYENNFYPNWSGYVTLISEGTVLNTGLTINLLPDIYWRSSQIFTGTNANNANLGTKVFIKNDIILASQPNGTFAGGTAPGPVIFYTGNNNIWRLGPNLTGIFTTNPAQFGTSLATWNGSPIVFGGPLDNNGTGSALVYTRNTPSSWISRGKLTGIIDKSPSQPFNPSPTSKYGTAVALSSGNDIILISSPWNNTGYGSTLVYTGNSSAGWRLKQEIVGIDANFYGTSLDIDNNANTIVLGGTAYLSNGFVNIFTGNKINGWNFVQSITGENQGNYGQSVAINSNASTIVIGGPSDILATGGILIYTGNSTNLWKFAQKISGDFLKFGKNVSISDDDTIVVSSDEDNKTSIFTKNINTNQWQLKQKYIFNNDSIGGTYISNSGTIVVGLPNLDSAIYTNPGGLTILNSGLDILTGMYRIPSGLSYLGYSGLNIEFNKYIYDNSKTGIDFAEYSVTSDNFTFTGIIRG